MSFPSPGVHVKIPPSIAEQCSIDRFNRAKVKRYIENLLREGLRGFVGKPSGKESREAMFRVCMEVYNHATSAGILEPGWAFRATEVENAELPEVCLLPPCKEQQPARHNSSEVGIAVASTNGVTHLAKRTEGAEMTENHMLEFISNKTGINRDRLLIERCSVSELSVDVLHGTDAERWAVLVALQECKPACTSALGHMKEPAAFKTCGYTRGDGSICGAKMKVVDVNRSGRVESKSRCSDPLCPNSRHWFPAYRPTSVRRPSPRAALTVDHGYDEPEDKVAADVATNPETEGWSAKPSPGLQQWVPKVGDRIVNWTGMLTGRIAHYAPYSDTFTVRVDTSSVESVRAGGTAELTPAELLRGWCPQGQDVPGIRWKPVIGQRVTSSHGNAYYIISAEAYGKHFELRGTDGRTFRLSPATLFKSYQPYHGWYPKLGVEVVEAAGSKQRGIITRIIDENGRWQVGLSKGDYNYVAYISDDEMLLHYVEVIQKPLLPKLKEPTAAKQVHRGDQLEPGMVVRHKEFHDHEGVLLSYKESGYYGSSWMIRWTKGVESEVSEDTIKVYYEVIGRTSVESANVVSREAPAEITSSMMWPKHLDSSWVGRMIVNVPGGWTGILGHEHPDGWDVHRPGVGTYRLPEKNIFGYYIPARR